jgi:hypothetical protein
MDDLSLLEKDVEETRDRLARHLDRLRSTETVSGFKDDVLAQLSEAKQHLVAKAKQSLSIGVDDLWREIKARAAANPAAALAIGAGLAWRISQRPPIASALVGIGLISLARTDPHQPTFGAAAVVRSGESLGRVKESVAAAWDARKDELTARVEEIGATAKEALHSAKEAAGQITERSAETIKSWTEQAQEVFPRITSTGEERDNYLLGAAALALAAAIGIASQRRE